MKLLSLALLALPAFCVNLQSGSASSNGVWVQYQTRLEPPSPPITSHGGGVLTENNIIKRHLCDMTTRKYFGYDLTVEPAGAGRFNFRFAPLSMSPQQIGKLFSGPAWTPLPLPAQPVTMQVREGETVALDLFANSSTGQKVTEYLTVRSRGQSNTTAAGATRDFGPEDATIELSVPKLSVDGKELVSTQGGVSGEALWIDVPGHGRFVFSLAARTDLGMKRAGEIRGSTMRWQYGGHEYRIEGDKPIASGSGAYNLYV
ncbi:MAG TPA: hypothetical protein VES20_24015, partial [Bryobacteraceae bacterium]|nr:hypothetical protein [Bryobacteraceae bacterium]